MLNRLLRVDLNTGEIKNQVIPVSYLREYIGGSGLAVRLLWDEFDPSIDPLAPENPLLWITGPLTGSTGPTTGRFTICGKSPQTGLWGESNIGGFVGPELRFAGYDAVWITGHASEPVYLWIHNGKVDIRPAGHLWGKTDTYTTQARIKQELNEPQAKVAAIGLAGENLVPFSLILSDHGRVAGRTGMGAIMGSKNLKAVAVRGTGKLPLEHPDAYRQLKIAANKDLIQQNMTNVFRETGTSGAAEYLQYLGDMPQKYWTAPSFDGAGKISGAEMAQTILVGSSACQGCVICCGREVQINDGSYATQGKVKGPEYETICSFGSQLLVDDLPLITALGDLCDRLGMDSISAGNTIALAYLMYEKGIITEKETAGLELAWGNGTPCFQLLNQMANREGFGALLAMGSKSFARHFGVEDLAVQVHNLEVAMHDPRAFSGMALVYVTSPRGACHNQGDYFTIDLGGTLDEIGIGLTDRFSIEGKAALVARHQHWRTVCNSLVMCYFAVTPIKTVLDLLSAASGDDWSMEELLLAGERAWNLKRIYNLRLGLKPDSEKLPKLLLQPLPEGGQEGFVPDLNRMLDEYYRVNGWDRNTGWPVKQKLISLGLDFAV